MIEDKTAIMRGMFRAEIEIVDRHCADAARMVHLGDKMGYAIRGTLRNGAVVSVTNTKMAGTGGSAGFWVDLCADLGGDPVAFFDGGGTLEDKLKRAQKLTRGQVADLRIGKRASGLPEEIEVLAHTVVTARSGDRVEVTHMGGGDEQLLVCDPNGSYDGDFFGFTLPRAELMTLLRQLTTDLGDRFGKSVNDAEHRQRHTEQRKRLIGAVVGTVVGPAAVLLAVMLVIGVVTFDDFQLIAVLWLLIHGTYIGWSAARDAVLYRRVTADLNRDRCACSGQAPKHARKSPDRRG